MGAAILSIVLRCLAIIQKQLPGRDGRKLDTKDILAALAALGDERVRSTSRISHSFVAFLQTHFLGADSIRLLTLSSSSTITMSITDALKDDNVPMLDVRILESRPLFEGVTMAKAIASCAAGTLHGNEAPAASATVTVYTDASSALAAKDVDIVLLGADLIDASGRVSNKTGSLPAVLAAKHVAPHALVVALADTDKILPFEPPDAEENDTREVLQAWNDTALSTARHEPQITVKNIYFEWVDAELIHHYVTEHGVTTTRGVQDHASDARQRANHFFEGL